MNPTLKWLALCIESTVLDEKWLLASEMRIGQLWKDRLALSGISHVNLHAKTLRHVAVSVTTQLLASRRQRLISNQSQVCILNQIARDLARSGDLKYLGASQSLSSLGSLLCQTLNDLRCADRKLDESSLTVFESADKASDLIKIIDCYDERMQARNLIDYPMLLELAIAQIRSGKDHGLPSPLHVIIPESFTCSHLEQRLINALCDKSQQHVYKPVAIDTHAATDTSNSDIKIRCFAGVGEYNEVRGALQRVATDVATLSNDQRERGSIDQVEIAAADYARYAPHVLELMVRLQMSSNRLSSKDDASANDEGNGGDVQSWSPENLPVTFAEGIPCTHSRPGRLLRLWIRWIESDCVQATLTTILREGLIVRSDSAQKIGYARLATTLRSIPIGFGWSRFQSQIEKSLARARAELHEHEKASTERSTDATDQTLPTKRDYGIPTLEALLECLTPLLKISNFQSISRTDMLQRAITLLRQLARAENRWDRMAASSLCSEIEAMQQLLDSDPQLEIDVVHWLATLPEECRILASSPKPGCVNVVPLRQAALSGRSNLFVLGLNEDSYPKRARVDPLLLDRERHSLTTALPTSASRSAEAAQQLNNVISRMQGTPGASLTLSYSTCDLSDDRVLYPSVIHLNAASTSSSFRFQQELHSDGARPVAFLHTDSALQIDSFERELTSLLLNPSSDARQALLEADHWHASSRRLAQAAIESSQFTAFDGLVPLAGQKQIEQIANGYISPSRLETFGSCPRKFFFQQVLKVEPPDSLETDPDQWLSALGAGNLLHDVFETFMRELTERNEVPDVRRDRERLHEILSQKIAAYRSDFPPLTSEAFVQQCQEFAESCDVFLAAEETYCRSRGARPWVMEACLGTKRKDRDAAHLATPVDCYEPIPSRCPTGAW